jgi:hypothetical protein
MDDAVHKAVAYPGEHGATSSHLAEGEVRVTLYALVRLRRGTAAAFGLCLHSAFIIAI